jgi:peptidoglycan/LPS O-acetylase OafA/YrhL
MKSSTSFTYRPDIDGLRGFQILALIGFHGFPTYVPGGFIGVSIFFVISGYLITSIIFKSFLNEKFSFIDFYSRRVRRIFPSLITILVAACIFGWFLLATEYANLSKYVVGGALFVDNFVALSNINYFDPDADLKPLLHLWSLGIEEQFYLFWPPVIYVVWRFGRNIFVPLVIFLFASFTLSVITLNNNPMLAFYAPWTRLYEIMAGSLLAYFHFNKSSTFLVGLAKIKPLNSKLFYDCCSLIGLAILIYGIFWLSRQTLYPGYWSLIPISGAILLIAMPQSALVNKEILSSKAMIWLGLISYPLYLWHWMLFSFGRIVANGEPPFLIKVCIAGVSILLAWFTYKFIENPLRFGGRIKAKTLSLIFFLLMVGMGGSLIYLNNGFKDRDVTKDANGNLIEVVDNWPEDLQFDNECLKIYSEIPTHFCKRVNYSSEPSVVLIGDSHGNSLYPGLAEFFKKQNLNLLHLGNNGCPALYHTYSAPLKGQDFCSDVMDKILDFVISNGSIKTVVISNYDLLYMTGHNFNNTRDWIIKPSNAEKVLSQADYFIQAMEYTLNRLIEAKKNIYYVLDWPDFGFDPKRCPMNNNIFSNSDRRSQCEISYESLISWNRSYIVAVENMKKKYPSVKFLSTKEMFCNSDFCSPYRNGMGMYRNGDHLSVAGSEYLGQKLGEKIGIQKNNN